MSILNRLNIRSKMLLILLTIFFAIFIFVFIFFSTLHNMEGYTAIEMSVEKLTNSMLMLRRHEKDFLLRKKLKYKSEFLQEYQHSLTLAKVLNKQLQEYNYHGPEIQEYLYNLKLYRDNFLNLTKAMQERGFDEKSGLYGSLREAIHKVQNYAKVLDSTPLLAQLYELRKNEKDFMLRKNLLYAKEFVKNFQKLNSIPIDQSMKEYLLEYKKEFLSLVGKEVLCGLNENLGLEGKMRKHVHKTEKLLDTLKKNILNFEIKEKDIMLKSMYITALLSILSVLFLIFSISNNIVKSLHVFQRGLLDFFDYLNKKKKSIFAINLEQKDEFGKMAELINQQISQTTQFLKEEEEKLDKLANCDQLTGIYNRRKFHELFELHINELKRYEKHFALILIDMDDFKKINDTYGHVIGDVVLKKFVEITKNIIRDVDIFARWGGEEFTILLPNLQEESAFIVAQKIRKTIEDYENDLIGSFTVSIGITSAMQGDTLDTIIERADKALYQAKAEGKNRVVVYKKA